MCRRKLQNKLKDADEAYTELATKYSSLEKAKNHIAAELEDLNLDLEKVKKGERGGSERMLRVCREDEEGMESEKEKRDLGKGEYP